MKTMTFEIKNILDEIVLDMIGGKKTGEPQDSNRNFS